MYISRRGMIIRNSAAALTNGAITLVLLLIAPLGLLAVITNTFLVTLSTLVVCTVADLVTVWLLPPNSRNQVINQGNIPLQNQFNPTRTQGELEERKNQ
jgi:hypothetical protein